MSGLLQFGIRLDRERFAALLARLGDPHKRLRCVHVAGTNGKGSTVTFIASVLQAAGFRVGAYLSPYVFDLRERIQINGALIPPGDFARWVTTIRPHIEAVAQTADLGQTTEFEVKTAVAFCYFAEQAVDFAVIEVGIGGRLDSTNVIPPPLAAVITSIGMDHQKLLGDTPGKIAAEKAGILKPGCAGCVTAAPPGEALTVIRETAQARGVPLRRVAPAAAANSAENTDAFVTYETSPAESGAPLLTLNLPSGRVTRLRLSLQGAFQAANAATAAAAIEVLRQAHGIPVSAEALRSGLERATLPGRFQVTRGGGNASGPALALDVAHNEDGARVLAEALPLLFPGKRFVFVLGFSRSHEPEPFLRLLAPLAARVVATAPQFRPKPADETAAAAKALGISTTIHEPASAAIQATWENAQAGEVVVVTGSFYIVGETPEDLRG